MDFKVKNLTIVIFYLIFGSTVFGQKDYIIQTVAFYNLENLFDTIDNPNKLDEISPIMEIKHNRSKIYEDKLSKLSSVISEIGREKNNFPPAIIGVAEVENRQVLEDLISIPPLSDYSYGIIHYESEDLRGIDTALLYNKKIFHPVHSEAISPKLYKENKRIYTRDILWVKGFLINEEMNILVNHWPSRRGGKKKSSLLRETVARANANLVKKIKDEKNDAKIIIMGDFNDNPNDDSIKKILMNNAWNAEPTENHLFNPFEKMFENGYNTLNYRGKMFLFDQIILTDNYLTNTKDYSEFRFYKSGVFNPNYMTIQNGKYKGSPKRSFSDSNYTGGYSDHYPVYIYLLIKFFNF